MPLVFPVLLLLILGAVTLASRTTNSFLTASKRSDAQAAKQAAESGMNRVLSSLNPYGKVSGFYVSYLLGAKWDKTKGTWTLAEKSAADVKTLLRQCRISARSVNASQPIPEPSQYASALLEGLIASSASSASTAPKADTEMRYTISDFVPPDSPEELPGVCGTYFDTVRGGTAQISVQGTVWRKSRKVATYVLTRTLDIQALPMPDVPTGFPNPGVPIALRITNEVKGFSGVSSYIYEDFENDSSPKLLSLIYGLAKLRPQCLKGTCDFPDPTYNIPAGDTDLPIFPFDTDTIPSGVTPAIINSDTTLDSANLPSTYCKNSQLPNQKDCWIASIGPRVNVTVDTAARPVNLIILGNVGGDDPKPTYPTPVPDSNYATIKHKNFDHTNTSLRQSWNRLRIFGREPTTAACSPPAQTFYLRSDAMANPSRPSLAGAFIWLPRGELRYGNSGGTGKPWVPNAAIPPTDYVAAAAEPIPGSFELMSSWWACNATLNLSGLVKFVLPLYGNPDAMSALLPSGYLNSSNIFTQDLRFPVYPNLLRIRSIF
jgi:hypothetical protein